ncbi:fimbrillin family protein [Bacteroides fluxus]|uniref:fimbrillin family protein n=1 Tax=Bacteroides fluxus TaxID=626930 RepID=UPI002A80FE32|nr:fimbrillin family protein [Bacteroides fluxus]MDY3790507.1 fimbrillin family protein [Bacteroides fluxus]
MFLSEYPSPSRFFKHSLGTFLSLLLLSACSPDNDALPGDDDTGNTPPAALRIEVSASDFTSATTRSNAGSNNSSNRTGSSNRTDDNNAATRATDSGNTTTFENGDRIGIIVLDAGGTVLSDNIPYIYDGTSWSFDATNSEGKTAIYYDNKAGTLTYLAYFPYSAEANGITSLDNLKVQFPPRYDQSTKDAYRASDLLVWSGVTSSTPSKTLAIAFTHAYASLSLSPSVKCEINGTATSYVPSSVSDASFTIGTEPLLPYRADDGSYRIIVSPRQTAARWFYNYKGEVHCGTITETNLAANNRYTLAPALNDIGAYTLADAQVGDFYCRNKNKGYLIPGDASLTKAQQDSCIGIVYSIDVSRIGKAATDFLSGKSITPHGLVMALTNASDGCRWGNEYTDENSGGNVGEPFKENTDQLQKQYKNVDGYGETHWIIENYRSNGNTALQNTYAAFYHASRYGTADSSTEKYTAPTNTTGWFIPGMGQWWDILSNLGGIDLNNYKGDTGGYTSISGAANTAVANINKYLQKISGATPFSTGTYFWSSSEYSGYRACYVDFGSRGNLYLSYGTKNYSRGRVRCSFAF